MMDELPLWKQLQAFRKSWDGTNITKPLRCPRCKNKTRHITHFLYFTIPKSGSAKNKIGWLCIYCGAYEIKFKGMSKNE